MKRCSPIYLEALANLRLAWSEFLEALAEAWRAIAVELREIWRASRSREKAFRNLRRRMK